jgi:hypothetical protein
VSGTTSGSGAVSGTEAAGETVIGVASTTNLAVGQNIFFKNTTLANSEFARIIALVANVSITVMDAIKNAQTGSTIYNQAEFFNAQLDLASMSRIRVVYDCSGTGRSVVGYARMTMTDQRRRHRKACALRKSVFETSCRHILNVQHPLRPMHPGRSSRPAWSEFRKEVRDQQHTRRTVRRQLFGLALAHIPRQRTDRHWPATRASLPTQYSQRCSSIRKTDAINRSSEAFGLAAVRKNARRKRTGLDGTSSVGISAASASRRTASQGERLTFEVTCGFSQRARDGDLAKWYCTRCEFSNPTRTSTSNAYQFGRRA